MNQTSVVQLNPVADRDRRTIEVSPDGIVVVDRHGVICDANSAAIGLLDGGDESLQGTSLVERLATMSRSPELAEQIGRRIAGPHTADTSTTVWLRHADRRVTRCELSVRDVGTDGTRQCAVFLRDATDTDASRGSLVSAAQRFGAILRHSSEAIALCANRIEDSVLISGEELLGYSAGTRLPEGFISLVHPDDHATAREVMMHVRGSGGVAQAELGLKTAEGMWRLCDVVAEDLSHDPAVRGVILRMVDMTADRAHEHHVESTMVRMRALIENLGAAVLLEDENRHVLVTNQSFVSLFQIPVGADEMIGSDCSSAAEGVKHLFVDPEGFVAGVLDVLDAGAAAYGHHLELTDGRVLERDYIPIRSASKPAGHLWVYRDVTEQMAERDQLTAQNRSLEELAILKNEFVARVSHELRSPLTSVVSFADMLTEATAGALGDDEEHYLSIIVRNAQRLLRLIEDLLLVAKLESHTLPLSLGLVDIPSVAVQVVDELQPLADAKSIDLTVDAPSGPRIRADVVRMQQLISNLVNNAIAYTPVDGRVEVIAEPDTEAAVWRLTVADNGVGIPADELPQLFDPFFRASTGTTQPNGTGLGLAIVGLIADEHGGSVDVESALGEGTRMTVTLPFEEV